MKFTGEYLQCNFGIDKRILELVSKSEKKLSIFLENMKTFVRTTSIKFLMLFKKMVFQIGISTGTQAMDMTTLEGKLQRKYLQRCSRQKKLLSELR